MPDFNETLRFPTMLEPAEIHSRLVKIHERAVAGGHAEIAAALHGLQSMPASEIGKAVIRALGLIDGQPELQPIARQLQILAVNLKNLK
jgi:hypothetical protein